jgi:serine/threonine protein kinase
MGQVYLGLSPGGRPVAVKVVRADFAQADSEYRIRFAREVEAARRVGGFHTAPVVDADPAGDPPWMVTAYIAGPSLATVVASNGPMTLEAATALGAALAEGLTAIHACGLVHRDLKPANIIMADDGPRIIDFGIARPMDQTSLTTPGTLIGTYAFMSPEQVATDAATPASDVFALGCVLVFAATGRVPFTASTAPAIMHRVLYDQPDVGEIPDSPFRAVVLECLSKDPARRPRPADLIARLSPGLGGEAAVARGNVPAIPSDRDAVILAATEPPRPDQITPERHENVTITQHANAAPGSVVIQIAGNAKIEGHSADST